MSWENIQKNFDESLNAMMDNGLTKEQGEAVIKAIAKGEIPHVSIKY